MPSITASRTATATQIRTSTLYGTGELKIIQEQVGHAWASTTGIYTGVSGDFMNTMLRQHLDKGLYRDEEE